MMKTDLVSSANSFSRVTGNPEDAIEDSDDGVDGGGGGGLGLPPSYSLLELDKDLPTYAQATQ